MEIFHYVITIAILLVAITAGINAKVNVSKQSHHLPGQKFGYSTNSLKDGKLVYTVCDTGNTQRYCKVVQEDIFNGQTMYSCDIVLKIEQKDMQFGLFLEFAFGKDKAILIWEEKQNFKMYVRFTTVQLPTCKVGESKLLDDNESLDREPIHHQLYVGHKVVTYENKYDVFFEDKATCGNKECRLSIDDEGKTIDKATPFVKNSPYHIKMLKPMSKNNPLEVFACLKMKKNELQLSMITPAVSEISAVKIDNDDSEVLGYSVENEMAGLCIKSRKESKLTCSQYDIHGHFKSEVNLPNFDDYLSSMYVLPNGGFLLFTLKVELCQKTDRNCDKYPVSAEYKITKVDPTGKTKVLRFEGFSRTKIGKCAEFIYKNPNGEGYCATTVYSKYDPTSTTMDRKVEDLNVLTNCFMDADFRS